MLLVGLIIVLSMSGPSTSGARDQWEQRPFNRYQMVINVNPALCRSEYIVTDEIISQIITLTPTPTGCINLTYTISDLFQMINDFQPGQCGPNGCACDGAVIMAANYDSGLGYPVRIKTFLDLSHRWHYPGYWISLLFGSACSQVGYIGTTIEVISLTPLP